MVLDVSVGKVAGMVFTGVLAYVGACLVILAIIGFCIYQFGWKRFQRSQRTKESRYQNAQETYRQSYYGQNDPR